VNKKEDDADAGGELVLEVSKLDTNNIYGLSS
jgi:hypothetical protein